MYTAGSLRAVAEEISKYRLDLVGVQEVRWDGGCTEPAGEYAFFYRKGNENHELYIYTALTFTYKLKGLRIISARHFCNVSYYIYGRFVSRDSSVGIATGYGLDDQGGREFQSR
jgi:hypothetical protein